MSPRRRIHNKYLPQYMQLKHGRFWFVENLGKNKYKWHNLGKTFHEALANYAKFAENQAEITTMNQLFDKYLLEVAPLKNISTYRGNINQMKKLKETFGNMKPSDILPPHIYKYLDYRKRMDNAPIAANREKALLSHVFTKAIEWGDCKENPCRFVKRNTESPSTRYITHDEFIAFHKFIADFKSGLIVQYAMELAYIISQRRGDIFKIKKSDLRDEGIDLTQNKTFQRTGNAYILEWEPELRSCINKILAIPRPIQSIYLFSTRAGHPYTADGFSSIWQRYMKKALEEGALTESFSFRDIRAKRITDIEDLHKASKLAGHTKTDITKRVYVRKAEKLSPKIEGESGVLLDKIGYKRQKVKIEKTKKG